jgi:hypothetical protein
MEQPPKASQRLYKKSSVVEVHVMFEPSHLAQQCLQNAYACLMPTVHRYLGQAQSTAQPAQPNPERNVQ